MLPFLHSPIPCFVSKPVFNTGPDDCDPPGTFHFLPVPVAARDETIKCKWQVFTKKIQLKLNSALT